VETFTEVESGRNSERPALAKALAAARVRQVAIVVAKVERLTGGRSCATMITELQASGARPSQSLSMTGVSRRQVAASGSRRPFVTCSPGSECCDRAGRSVDRRSGRRRLRVRSTPARRAGGVPFRAAGPPEVAKRARRGHQFGRQVSLMSK
jgi:hypothetical protein